MSDITMPKFLNPRKVYPVLGCKLDESGEVYECKPKLPIGDRYLELPDPETKPMRIHVSDGGRTYTIIDDGNAPEPLRDFVIKELKKHGMKRDF